MPNYRIGAKPPTRCSTRLLRAWQFVRILSRRGREGPAAFDAFDPWEVWECPEFFPLGDRHVLLYSTAGKSFWQTGELDEKTMTFHPGQAGILDYGSYYAAKTQLDQAGNRIVWGWIQEARPLAEYKAAGWAGLMSLPRVLTVAADGRLRIGLAPEVALLRGRRAALSLSADEDDNRRQLDALRVAGCCGEIRCEARRTAEPFAMRLSASPSGELPCLSIEYNPLHSDPVSVEGRPLPLTLRAVERLEFEIHVDGSVLELLVNREIAWTKRFYVSGDVAPDLHLQWNGKTAPLASLEAWAMNPISADRLTT